MSISVRFLDTQQLEVTGDVNWRLCIPADAPMRATLIGAGGDGETLENQTLCDTFLIAVSDGTLLRAGNDPREPNFEIVREGAGIVTVSDDGQSFVLDFHIEWVVLSSNRNALGLKVDLPLFD